MCTYAQCMDLLYEHAANASLIRRNLPIKTTITKIVISIDLDMYWAALFSHSQRLPALNDHHPPCKTLFSLLMLWESMIVILRHNSVFHPIQCTVAWPQFDGYMCRSAVADNDFRQRTECVVVGSTSSANEEHRLFEPSRLTGCQWMPSEVWLDHIWVNGLETLIMTLVHCCSVTGMP